MDYQLLIAVIAGIAVLLFLILFLRIQAFISLLIASIVVAVSAGMPLDQIVGTIKQGMGGTLGFVAVVVGLGAMFGAILEHTGGAKAIAKFLLDKMGISQAPFAMALAGFVIAIPVFFDVAFIILTPVIYALQRKTGKSLLLYAIPLLAGLAITHTFIPPTPGPVAVAEALGASLGWVIMTGALTGIPTLILCGLVFGQFIAKKIHVVAPAHNEEENTEQSSLPAVSLIFFIISVPIFLILMSTTVESHIVDLSNYPDLENIIKLLGHPFSALIISNLLAWYLLGYGQGLTKDKLFDITTKSMAPAGTIILLTGAGGVFKQVLISTKAGELLANTLVDTGIPIMFFAFIAAALIRIIQGSATVAMLTAASIIAPLLAEGMGEFNKACMVIAIASGASILSHVNDSGFWLVGQYLGMTEKQTAKSWTVMTTILALTGFASAFLMSTLFG